MIRALLLLLPLLAASCATPPPRVVPSRPGMPQFTGEDRPPPVPITLPGDAELRTTIVPGEARAVVPPGAVAVMPGSGGITLAFPAADVKVVAQAVLGDILKVPFTIPPGLATPVTLVTAGPIPRAAVFGVFEDALKTAGLAITQANGIYAIQQLDAARGAGVIGAPGTAGFATETIQLQFVQAEEMRKLLDPILPGVVSKIDPGQNSLVITGTTGQRSSARDLLRQFDVNWLRGMNFALYVPQRTDSRLIVPELDKLINAADAPTRGLVRLIAMERLNGILAITAQRQYLDDVRRWIEILDREGQNNERRLFVYRVQNSRSKDLARTLNAAFGNAVASDSSGGSGDDFALDGSLRQRGGDGNAAAVTRSPVDVDQLSRNTAAGRSTPIPGGSAAARAAAAAAGIRATISSDEAQNAIIVFGSPREYAVIEDALRKLDVLPYQVLIEAAITEVTLNDDLRYGVQWNFQAGDTNFALSETNTPNPGRLLPGFSFFFSNSNDISVTLNALENRTNINVISAPKLLVLNNQTASLQVGDQVPITTQSAVGVVNPDAPIVNSVEYRDTGVILKITPRVNSGGLVLLDIAQEVSDVATTRTSGIDSPTIATRRIATSIAVQDGQVVALGGLIRDTQTRGKNGLPWLSRIPLLGGLLFGNVNDTDRRTELLVLIKPRVLRTIDDARAVTDELRSKIRTLEPVRDGRLP